jgi:hypothetical protein
MAENETRVEQAQAAVDAAQKKLNILKGSGKISETVAASKELSAAQKELAAAKRGIDTTGKTRQEVIRETVRTGLTEKTQALAESDPMRNPTVRPDAPPADEENIYYYAWIGGAYGGSWKLYKQAKTGTEAQVASAEARSRGGATQATFETAVGANTLLSSSKNVNGKTETGRVTNPDGSITITYSDGTTSVIPAKTSGSKIETGAGTGSTNIDVLKAMLRGLGYNSAIVDSSASFLISLLKDGLDYDNAVAIFLNSKDYTLKDGKKIESPFYAEYSYLNEGLVRPKSASELYNAVEGYKEVASTYNLNPKFTSKDYLKGYVKNNVTVDNLAQRANLARLKSVNADPAYIDSLKTLGYITSATDLTDFFLDPKIGEETLMQRRSVAAFGAEAIKRAKQGVQFSTSRFDKIVSGLLGVGLSPEQIEVRAAQGFENIAETLMPMTKLAGIYQGVPTSQTSAIQAELETEEFGGLASQRRKNLTELERRAFQAQTGVAGSRSLGGGRAGII